MVVWGSYISAYSAIGPVGITSQPLRYIASHNTGKVTWGYVFLAVSLSFILKLGLKIYRDWWSRWGKCFNFLWYLEWAHEWQACMTECTSVIIWFKLPHLMIKVQICQIQECQVRKELELQWKSPNSQYRTFSLQHGIWCCVCFFFSFSIIL